MMDSPTRTCTWRYTLIVSMAWVRWGSTMPMGFCTGIKNLKMVPGSITHKGYYMSPRVTMMISIVMKDTNKRCNKCFLFPNDIRELRCVKVIK